MSKCGECLMRDVEVVELREDGKCPRCGVQYATDAAVKASAKRMVQKHQKSLTRLAVGESSDPPTGEK